MTLLFIHIPKNAGGSIKAWANKQNLKNFKCFGHYTLDYILENKSNTEYTKSFCVVRNTYDHWISRWRFAKQTALKRLKKNSKNISAKESLYVNKRGISYWMDWYHDGNGPWPISQLDYIKNIDYVLSFENLDNDFKIIQDFYKSSRPLEKNVHVSKPFNKRTVITNDFIKTVNRYYGQEIDYFNYTI